MHDDSTISKIERCMSHIYLSDLNKDNWLKTCQLSLAPHQKGWVSENVYSIAEAKVFPHYHPRIICKDGQIIGFLMYCSDIEHSQSSVFWLFRLMFDQAFQSKGYGRQACQLAIEEMIHLGACQIKTMYKPENVQAERLYIGLGFQATGEKDECGDSILEFIVKNDA